MTWPKPVSRRSAPLVVYATGRPAQGELPPILEAKYGNWITRSSSHRRRRRGISAALQPSSYIDDLAASKAQIRRWLTLSAPDADSCHVTTRKQSFGFEPSALVARADGRNRNCKREYLHPLRVAVELPAGVLASQDVGSATEGAPSIETKWTLDRMATRAAACEDADRSIIGGKRAREFAGAKSGSGFVVAIWIAVVHEPWRFSASREGAPAACDMPEKLHPAVPLPFGHPIGHSPLELVLAAAENWNVPRPRAAAFSGMSRGRRIHDCSCWVRSLTGVQEGSAGPRCQVTGSRQGRTGRASTCRAAWKQ